MKEKILFSINLVVASGNFISFFVTLLTSVSSTSLDSSFLDDLQLKTAWTMKKTTTKIFHMLDHISKKIQMIYIVLFHTSSIDYGIQNVWNALLLAFSSNHGNEKQYS